MTTCVIREHLLPEAAIGITKKLISVHFGQPGQTGKVYIQAGLHADEAPGCLVATRLLELLRQADSAGEITGEIVIVPAANPIGLGQWGPDTVRGRFDDCDYVNFNRNHYDLVEETSARLQDLLGQDPAENTALIRKCVGEILGEKKPVTEAEALKHLLLSLSHDADIVLDLHCDHQAVVHVYMGTALWPQGADLSAQMGAGATLLANDSGGMPFDEANSRLWWELAARFPRAAVPSACLAATVELRGLADTDPGYTGQDAQNLFWFLKRRGFLAGSAPALPPLLSEATPLAGVDYITAAGAGILSYLKQPGDQVARGEPVAFMVRPMTDPLNGEKQLLVSRTAGIFFARSADRFARPGKIVGKVAGQEPLEGKGPNLLTS